MEKLNVLLVCGSGASSGFMAANMRKAASKQGLDIDIKARSESEIENYIDEINVLMVGPHLAYILDEVEEYTHGGGCQGNFNGTGLLLCIKRRNGDCPLT